MRLVSLATFVLAGLGIVLVPTRAYAEDVDKQVEAKIEAALKAYKAGQTGEAMSSLQDAITMMQKSAQKSIGAFFPKAPEGWEAGKLDSQSLSAGGDRKLSWITLTQTFTRKTDELKVTVMLANSPQMIQAQKGLMQAFKNPEALKMMNADPKHQVKLIEQSGWVGIRQITKGEGEDDKGKAEITAFTDACVLTVRVDQADETVLDTFFKAIDLKGLAAAAPKSKKTDKPENEE